MSNSHSNTHPSFGGSLLPNELKISCQRSRESKMLVVVEMAMLFYESGELFFLSYHCARHLV